MGPKPSAKGAKPGAKPGAKLSRPSKPASKSKTPYKPKKRDEIKAKRPSSSSQPTKKKRTYTDKELNIPTLNMITPAGVQKPRGKKKGKVFVDDQESMMTILAMVNADKEGQIESKMIKQRQMEEIREARQAEMEKRKAIKDGKLEQTKDSLRKGRKRKTAPDADSSKDGVADAVAARTSSKKRVSFG